jgi:hypothetical protein
MKDDKLLDSFLGSAELADLRLLDEYQLAELFGLPVTIIRRRRAQRLPPTFVRIGHAVRYRPQDIREFIFKMQPNARPGAEQNQRENAVMEITK